RVALEHLMAEDAPEVRMPFEFHAEHVERLALVPVVAFENADGGGDGLILGDADLEADALVRLRGVELVDDVEAPAAAAGIVDAEEVEGNREAAVPEGREDIDDRVPVDGERRHVLSALLLQRIVRDLRGDFFAA